MLGGICIADNLDEKGDCVCKFISVQGRWDVDSIK
jgi:hypothetical protein